MIKTLSNIISIFLTFVLLFSNLEPLFTIEIIGDFASNKGNKSTVHIPYQGVNFLGYNTTLTESRDYHKPVPNNYFDESFRIISEAGLNIVRYLITWESYDKNPSLFMEELIKVAGYADKWGINVIYTNNQFHISSWLDPPSGYGFPPILFRGNKDLPYGGGGASDNETAKLWWINWYNRTINDVNGNDGWRLQAEYLKKIVDIVDNHRSTLGYEILNEPQVYSADQWKKIGNYNTFIAQELRKLTSKIIVFDRQLPSDIGGPIYALPDNIANMVPKNTSNLVFKGTLFGLPTHCSFAEARLNTAAMAAQLLRIPLWLGEFNIGITPMFPLADINQSQVDLFISKFREVNAWGWSFWTWSFREHPPNVKNYDLVNVTEHGIKTTKYFDYLKNAVSEYGRNASLNPKGNEKQLVDNNRAFHTSVQTDRDHLMLVKDTICPTVSITKINGTIPGTDFSKSTTYNPIPIYVKTLPARVLIAGEVYDSGSGINAVEIRLKDTSYQPIVPGSDGTWSKWSHILMITNPSIENELIIRAIDNAGNVKHQTLFVNIVKG
jgi:hypothetical protein